MRYTYSPYGAGEEIPVLQGFSSDHSYKYAGREEDVGGMYFYRSRYYNTVFQRFHTEDAAGFVDGANLYAYVSGNPLAYVDSFGDCGLCAFFARPPVTPRPMLENLFKITRRGVSGKEGAKDVPSWARGERPKIDGCGKDFAKRLMDEQYGPGNWQKIPERMQDFSKLKNGVIVHSRTLSWYFFMMTGWHK